MLVCRNAGDELGCANQDRAHRRPGRGRSANSPVSADHRRARARDRARRSLPGRAASARNNDGRPVFRQPRDDSEGVGPSRPGRLSAANAPPRHLRGGPSSRRRVRVPFHDPRSGEILLPFTRVLCVSVDASRGPWQEFLDAKRCVRVERLVWVEGDSPAFSQFQIAFDHGRHLLEEPIGNLHGVSLHRILGRRFTSPRRS